MTAVAKTRVILDLRGLVRHAYYRGTPIETVTTGSGERAPAASHGVDQFLQTYLLPILQTTAPIDIIAVQEGPHSLARRRAYLPEYKARKEQDHEDDVIRLQKDILDEHIRKLLLALGCMIVKTPYAEADDTIAYLVERLDGNKIVHTVDNDLLQLQLPQNKVVFYVKMKHTGTYEGMPLAPHNCVRVYKSIVGDSTDQYVGVRGLGAKAWETLVASYGLDGMVELDEIVRKDDFGTLENLVSETGDPILRKLFEQRDQWSVSYKMAALHPEWCERSFNSKVVRPKWEKRVPTMDRLKDALMPLGLGTYIEELRKYTVQQFLLDKNKMHKINRPKLIEAMRKSPFIPFDYESFDSLQHEPFQRAKKSGGYVDVLNQKITGASFCFGSNLQHSFYLPVKHRDTYNCTLDDLDDMFGSLEGCELVAHNAAFELTVSKTNLNREFPRMWDTGIMASYVDENTRSGLKLLSKHYLNYDQTTYRDVVPEGKDMRDVSGEEVLSYGCDDSITCAHLAVLFRTIMECERTWGFYEENEPYFEKAMLDGFIKGIPLDYARLAELREADEKLYEEADTKVRQLLEEHCSSVNEEGYAVLRAEIEVFEQKKLREKGKTEDEIAEVVNGKMVALRAACRYVPNAPITVSAKKSWVSTMAKKLNLPTIRSIKEEWIQTYYSGIQRQIAEGAVTTATQREFLDLLHAAVIDGTDHAVDSFEAFMQAFVNSDKSMWSGDELNARSPKQMAELFYGKMGLPVRLRNIGQKGKKSQREIFELEGMPSTNENALRTWMIELDKEDWRYQVLDNILKIRGVNTRMSLYYIPYPLWQSPLDKRTHPQIRNCGTVTRRPAGTSYNILQVSKTKDEGLVRGVFQSQSWDKEDVEEEVIVSIDFVQQELVILAGESNDPTLRACYSGPLETRSDVHTSTGLTIFKVRNPGRENTTYAEFAKMAKDEKGLLPENQQEDHTRRPYDIRKVFGKRTNFLATYGGGPSGLARKLIVPKDVAIEFLDGFFSSYPKVKDYQEERAAFARQHGFVTTCFGNRRHLYNIHDANKAVAASAERQAGNTPIQGGAADVLKIVMREYVKRDVAKKTGATLYAPIYDELVLSCPISKVYMLVEMLADIMEMELPGLNIKLDTSVSVGHNWGEQVEIGSRPTEEVVNRTIEKILSQKQG